MKGKLNGLSRRRARTRNGRNDIETLPNKLRCRPWRPTGMPKSTSCSCSDDSNQAVAKAVGEITLNDVERFRHIVLSSHRLLVEPIS
jgi:hypothetical protein